MLVLIRSPGQPRKKDSRSYSTRAFTSREMQKIAWDSTWENLGAGGGVPLTREGAVIAGIGVSGGTAEQDISIVEAALK